MNTPSLDELRPRFASQYTLERELGRGGMGIVFLARELSLDRQVAIKVLPPHLASDPLVRERFLREARTAAQLSHPNIVPIFRADAMDGIAFFAMGYVEGETLADRLVARGTLSPSEAVRVVREVAWALAYAHARGVVHRDIKPENIMLERATGRVTVTDFGIARDSRSSALTADGMVLGSVHYMSPEQVSAGEVDGRSDLYALGVVAFQLLSGRLPFNSSQPSAVLLMQATQPAPPLAEVAPTVPAPLAAVVDRCLRKDAAARYPTGEALAEAFAQAMQESQSGAHGTPDVVLSEDAAKGVWLRAAQMQADASRAVRERTAQAEAYATGIQSAAPTSGYRRSDVEAAGVEAGISPEFIQLALAELPDRETVVSPAPSNRRERLATVLLGTRERTMRVSSVIQATPVKTLEAIGRLFPAHPYNLIFKDTVGGHPLDGGVLSFAVRKVGMTEMSIGNQGTLSYYMSVIDAHQLRVTIHPVVGDPHRCEVTITTDLRHGVQRNAKYGVALGTGLGGTGMALGLGLAIAKGAAALAVPVGLGAFAVFGGAMALIYRWSFQWGLGRARAELQQLLDTIAASARSQDIFGVQPPIPQIPPPRGAAGGSGWGAAG